jgi:hypothetical protein
MAGGIGGAGGASGGLGSSGGFSSFASAGGDAGAARMSIAAATPTDFSAQSGSESAAASASSSSANAQVATGFDATASLMSDGADAITWKPQPPTDEAQPSPAAAMQPSDDVLAQVCAAYSASQM